MHLLDWAVVVVYLVWIVWDGLRRSKATDEVEGYFLANRSLPWWAVGLSVMATQLSRHHAGRHDRAGLRGRHARSCSSTSACRSRWSSCRSRSCRSSTARGSSRRTSTSSGASTRRRARWRACLFLLSRGLSCGVIIAAPAVILSIVLGWNLTLTILGIGVPTVLYTMVGGVQAVTWTDVKQMVVIIAGVGAAVAVLLSQLPDDVSRRRGAAHRRGDGPPAGPRLHVRPEQDLHVLVGPHRRPVPDAVVLRLRPEPGAALPHGEVGRRGAPVAADERLLQDPAAGPDPADRRADVRLLPVQPAARCCSTGCTTRRCAPARAPASTGRSSSEFTAAFEARRDAATALAAARRAGGAERARRARARSATPTAGWRRSAATRHRARARGDRRQGVHRRELRVSRPSSPSACRSASSA